MNTVPYKGKQLHNKHYFGHAMYILVPVGSNVFSCRNTSHGKMTENQNLTNFMFLNSHKNFFSVHILYFAKKKYLLVESVS